MLYTMVMRNEAETCLADDTFFFNTLYFIRLYAPIVKVITAQQVS